MSINISCLMSLSDLKNRYSTAYHFLMINSSLIDNNQFSISEKLVEYYASKKDYLNNAKLNLFSQLDEIELFRCSIDNIDADKTVTAYMQSMID